MENKVLIILGMHRSGTSLVSNWLFNCGLFLGDELYRASEFNKNGYFEDVKFLNLHKKLLLENNIHSSGHEEIGNVILTEKQIKEISTLVKSKNKKLQWAWKEPRTCLFLEYYKKILPNAVFLVVYRDCNEVVASLVKRERKYKKNLLGRLKKTLSVKKWSNHYSKIWLHYNTILLNQFKVKDENVIYTEYNSLLKNDKIIFNKLKKNGFDLNYIPFNTVFDDNLINKGAKRNYETPFKKKKEIEKVMLELIKRSI